MKKRKCQRVVYPPSRPIPFVPFTYAELATQLDVFIEKVYPFYDFIVTRPYLTQEDVTKLFSYLDKESQLFVEENPYFPNFQKIFTLVRNDGIVTIDKVSSDPKAFMVLEKQIDQSLNNIVTIRDQSGQIPPFQLPSPLQPVSINGDIKVYTSPERYATFESFSSRLEFLLAAQQTYGWATRAAIYETGQLYCVARLVTFSNTLQLYFRLSYLRKPTP